VRTAASASAREGRPEPSLSDFAFAFDFTADFAATFAALAIRNTPQTAT
jgi:hypothetical protein